MGRTFPLARADTEPVTVVFPSLLYTHDVQVDRGGYLVFVTSIALGCGMGYVASEKDLVPHLKDRHPEPKPEPPPVPVAVVIDAGPPVAMVVDSGPACDDSIGEAGDCPPIGPPTIEGGCGPFAMNRCNDFKRTMKPRVAQAAVACLNKLSYSERCDAKRVDLCAHQALMSACDDRAPTSTAVTSCETIAKSCTTISKSECHAAMSGMKELGRELLVTCATKHCTDKGILGCEAVTTSFASTF